MLPDLPPAADLPGSGHAPDLTREPLSRFLLRFADASTRSQISIGELLAAMQDRALAALLFLFALPNIVPMPPGTSSLLGVPLILLSVQLALGRPAWLPQLITRRGISRERFAAVVRRMAPWLQRAERLLRPRLPLLVRPSAERLIGVACLLLSVVLYLPIPLSNMPPALAICLFALGILEGDGVWVLAGFVTGTLAVLFTSGVVYALVKTGLYLLANVFA
jgi:hypothetical protein